MAGGEDQRISNLGSARMEAFSDGVFAVAITLLVLEISVPEDSQDDLLRALLDQWPSYLAYIVSFATVGAVWLGHSAMTNFVDHVDELFLRLNLLLLLLVAFLPFPTRLLAESIADDTGGRVASTFYGLTLLAVVGLLSALWRYARHENLVDAHNTGKELSVLTRRLTPGLTFYAVMILLGLVMPVLAVLGYLAIAVFYLAPIHHLRAKRVGRRR